MQGNMHYRGYALEGEGGEFVARPLDEDEPQIEIIGRSTKSLMRYIDEVWNSADKPLEQQPVWIRELTTGSMMRRIYPAQIISAGRKTLRRWLYVVLGCALLAATPAMARALDYDGDGHLTICDAFDLYMVYETGSPNWNGRIVVDDHMEDVSIRPTPTEAAFLLTNRTVLKNMADN